LTSGMIVQVIIDEHGIDFEEFICIMIHWLDLHPIFDSVSREDFIRDLLQ
jgi:hypothetical protein